MKTWQRRILALAAILGGWMGVTTAIAMAVGEVEALTRILCLLFIAVFAWGLWLGVRLLEGHQGALRPLAAFWYLQVPIFGSPFFSYTIECGLSAPVTLQLPFKLAASASFGTDFTLLFNSPGRPYLLGINVFALVVAQWLQRLAKSS